MISRTDPDRELYEARLRERRDKAAAQQTAETQGWAKGRAEGRAEHIQFLQRSLRQNVTSLEQLRSLSAEELANLARQLEDQLDAKLGNGS